MYVTIQPQFAVFRAGDTQERVAAMFGKAKVGVGRPAWMQAGEA